MSRRRFPLPAALSVFVVAAIAVAVLASAAVSAGAGRSPAATEAEKGFFAAFNGFQGEERAKVAPLRNLLAAVATDPTDARTWLILGLNHLWIAAEGDRTDPRLLDHLFLAERYLARAEELNPKDRRIPSWLVPVRLSIAEFEGKRGSLAEIRRGLDVAYEEDPDFHSFSVGLLGIAEPKTSPAFKQGLEALRAAVDACPEAGAPEADPTCGNTRRWPHNREGFLTFIADYELKAGNVEQARQMLKLVQQDPDYPKWPFRAEAEDRVKNLERYAALFANSDPGDDPPHLVSGLGRVSCQVCHRGQ